MRALTRPGSRSLATSEKPARWLTYRPGPNRPGIWSGAVGL